MDLMFTLAILMLPVVVPSGCCLGASTAMAARGSGRERYRVGFLTCGQLFKDCQPFGAEVLPELMVTVPKKRFLSVYLSYIVLTHGSVHYSLALLLDMKSIHALFLFLSLSLSLTHSLSLSLSLSLTHTHTHTHTHKHM